MPHQAQQKSGAARRAPLLAALLLACGPTQDLPAERIWDEPALVETDGGALLRALPALNAGLARVPDTSLTILTPEESILLLNDLWGVAARLDALGASSADARTFASHRAHVRAVLVARARSEAPWVCDDAPPAMRVVLPASEGWVEGESELPVLSHERAFGLRRVFRVFVRGSERALASQLVFVDAGGVAHPSCVVGEIEMLDVGPEGARSARLFELERRRNGERGRIVEVTLVANVPGLGADSFLFRPPSPVPLSDLPCRSCHDDAADMSLPRTDLPIGRRVSALMTQGAELHARLGAAGL